MDLDGRASISARASALLACPLSCHREMCWGSQAMPAISPAFGPGARHAASDDTARAIRSDHMMLL